jgi:hypothetical protein
VALSYSATIQVRLEAAAALKQADQLVAKINKDFGRLGRELAKKGPVDSIIQQNDALVEQLQIQRRAQSSSKAAIRDADREIKRRARLNAALERQANLKKALERAGVREGTGRGNQVRDALEAAKVNKEDLGIQQAINAELEKILQTQREINRTDLAQAKIAAKNAVGKSYDQRVKALENVGASQDALLKIEQIRGRLSEQNARKQTDLARQTTFELEEQLKALEAINAEALKAAKTGGGSSTGTGAGTGRSRLGNIAQGAILGGGFPLLFGGPSFSAAGGLLGGGIGGGIGTTGKFGFAGGIAGSVIGGIFDSVVKAALELGKALENPTKNLQALADQLPISGTATKGLIEQLEEAGLSSVAASLALSALDKELEALGLNDEDIKEFRKQTQEFDNAFKKLKLASSALASEGLINFMTLLTRLATAFKENKDGIVQGIRALGGLVIGDDRAIGEKLGMGPTTAVPPGPLAPVTGGSLARAATEVKPLQTEQELRAQRVLADLARREVKFATDAAAIERNRLGLIRGRLAEANAIVDIDKARFNLIKAQLNFDTETNGALKEQLRIKRDIAQAELNQAIAAKDNATILRIQADAAFDLERRMVRQAEAMKDLQAGTAAQQAVRATSPFQNESFLLNPFFGSGNQLQSEQTLRFTETLKLMNAELANVNKNIELGTLLNDEDKRALEDKRIELENNIARYKEYQPAIDEAALAQARFNEALAITTPITNDLFDSITSVVQGTKTAEQAFADFLKGIASMLADAAKQIIATYIAIGIARLFAGVPAGGGGTTPPTTMPDAVSLIAGKGAAIGQNGVIPFAKGGIVNKPSLFRFGSGGSGKFGLMGEAGPEAIMPLRRGPGGVLGVEAHGGGGGNITVNVDASGSSVEGNGEEAAQLGKAIGVAVQQELIKQKRPGGLLA